MNKIAQFHKVSKETFSQGAPNSISLYESITLPKRSTHKSAGYDFIAYEPITIEPGQTVTIPTGIKAQIEDGWFLGLLPRSGHGFKYRLQLDNTMGIIDADYYNNPNNEGHIFVKLTNDSKSGKTLFIEEGQGYCQGIFLPFGITVDDEVNQERAGGFGSTDQK